MSDLVGFRLSLVTVRIAFDFDDGREHSIEVPADLLYDNEGNPKLFDEDYGEAEKAMVGLCCKLGEGVRWPEGWGFAL